MNTKKTDSLIKVVEDLNSMLKDSFSYEARTERYCILILQELDKKKAIDDKSKEKILKKSIKNLETYLLTNNFNSSNFDYLFSGTKLAFFSIINYSMF